MPEVVLDLREGVAILTIDRPGARNAINLATMDALDHALDAAADADVLVIRGSLPPAERWWVWTCVTGLVMGLFGLWYVPHLQRRRVIAAERRAARPDRREPVRPRR